MSLSPVLAPPGTATKDAGLEQNVANGIRAAKVYCQTCHLFPEPDLLDKKTWKEHTLHSMKIRMGLDSERLKLHPEVKILKAAGVIPERPMVSEQDWNSIVDYYTATAPAVALPQDPREEISVGLKLFRYEKPTFRHDNPATTMVKIGSAERRIYLGDAESKSLDILDATGELLESIPLSNVPVFMNETSRGIYLTLIGRFLPSDDPKGEVAFLERTEKSFAPPKALLTTLPRPTHTEFADFNGDGETDFVVSMFGNMAGKLSWYENLGNEHYQEHVLIPKPGALKTVVQDFNGDGIPDIAVLVAQEQEALFLLINDGRGNFTSHTVFRQPPIYGHTYFETADFDGDGRPDFLVTNGDNGEYPSPPKKYHGIRIYLNKGDDRFELAFFYPLNGAFKAVARDFDQDGDLDIAAISFYPDYQKSPKESFVYLENKGGMRFRASTFRQCISGRWLTMDVDDLDGDGDLDIVLGSYIHGPTEVPDFLMNDWEKIGPSVIILRNKLHDPK
ncbi:MAG: VCBS repeat-containing protein [Verrucomicrobiota bacterium]